jgi:acylphosphatase
MKKCLKISFSGVDHETFTQTIQKHGTKLGIEGTIQTVPAQKSFKIIVCGDKDDVDKFVDVLHKETAQAGVTDVHIEPFVKAKDYRGVFRVIE